ncbi:MAG TPA: tetratricopeptide repeat protein [Bacteriovoracaceae bacterium]|nr:tetratricopeptide repeat protein [Bacteriovoracaceae bacterium]
MRTLILLTLSLVLFSCSSVSKKDKDASLAEIDSITNEDFNKDRPIEKNQVRDYFVNNRQVLENPVLKDETLNRLTSDEVKEFQGDKDPLVSMAYLCTRNQFKEAYAIAAKNFDRLQKLPSYWNQLGICYLDQKEYRKSLLYFNKALEAEKDYVPTLNNFGVMYSRLGQHQKAIVAYEKASQVGKFSKTPRYNLAKLYLEFGLSEKALPILQSLSNQAQLDVGIANSIATAYLMRGDHNAAIRFYRQLPSKLWSRPEIGLNLALAYHLAGHKGEATKIIKNVSKPKKQELKQYYSLIAQKIGVKL